MSDPISPIKTPSPSTVDETMPLARAAKKDSPERIKQIAQEFEGLMLKQLLAHMDFGLKASGVEAGLATEALASGLTKAGGLGLQRQLEMMISKAQHRSEHSSPTAPVQENAAVKENDS
jgi:Rod binding domain-containing protein